MRCQRGIKFITFLLLVIGVSGTEIATAYAGVRESDSEIYDYPVVSGERLSPKNNSLSAVIIDVPGGLGFEFTHYLEDQRQLAISASTWLFLTKGSANLRYYLRKNNLRRHHRISTQPKLISYPHADGSGFLRHARLTT